METLIDALSEEEQQQIDPHLFTCCPNCQTNFKIPSKREVVRGDWELMKQLTYYKGELLPFTPGQSHVFFELAKSHIPLKASTLGYRVTKTEAETQENIVAVHLCRIRKILAAMSIPMPIETIRGMGYKWKA